MIIAVLGFVVLLSAILAAFMLEATYKIKYFGLFYNRDDLRVLAYSYLETSLAVVNEIREIDRTLNSPTQGWGNPLHYAGIIPRDGYNVDIRIVDESGKIALATADEMVLRIIFEEMGIGLMEAEQLSDALLDWMDSDDLLRLNGAEEDYYASLNPPYKPPGKLIQSWNDLRLIKEYDKHFFDEEGIPNQNHQQFLGAVTLYNQGKVNVNAANGFVLRVLSRLEGWDQSYLETYLIGLDGERGTGDDGVIDSGDSPYLNSLTGQKRNYSDNRVQIMKITVTVSRGDASFMINTVVGWKGSNPAASAGSLSSDRRIIRGSGKTSGRGGMTAAQADIGAKLGYPFTIVRLTENFKF